MSKIPVLTTDRLRLRPFTLADAPEVQRLAGAREIAETTAHIPHPYQDGMAEAWIARHQPAFDTGEAATFAITLKDAKGLIGAVGLQISAANQAAELGYWVGKPYWGQGYATEASAAVLEYAFAVLGLHRVQARYMTKNPASGRVMQKIGMKQEGILRDSLFRWGNFEDVAMYSILGSEYTAVGNR